MMARQLGDRFAVHAEVIVLNIQVAALMTGEWIARKLKLPNGISVDRVIVPGYCRGDLQPVEDKLGLPVEKGPTDLHDLPTMFVEDSAPTERIGYGNHSIEIIAEINHAPELSLDTLIAQAESLASDGADVIDIGCDPQSDRPAWRGVGDAVRAIRDRGLRVSIDSFHSKEIAEACVAGAELVLSVNSHNCDAAGDWGVQVVVVPDDPHDLATLEPAIKSLQRQDVHYRIDPVIEPIGYGFAASLGRYLETRQRFGQTPTMMGIGNMTEMTGVDSAGVNMLLIGFCQELDITSVLTTQVINWCRSAVREIDAARKMMHYAVTRHTAPKHVDERLVMLRDTRLPPVDGDALDELASRLTDTNIRIFTDAGMGTIHAMNKLVHARGDDPYAIFDQLGIDDPSHAFYLGYEMAKAVTAVTLGKHYRQDEPLNWGMLTRPEVSHHERRRNRIGK